MESDAEEIQRVVGKGNSGDRDRRGGGRRPDLRGICGRAAGRVSINGGNVRRDARGRSSTPRPVVCDVPAAFWRPHSADPAGKREGYPAKETGVAGKAAGREGRKEASGIDGDGGEPVLRARGEQDDGRVDAGIVEQACGRREKTHPDCR